MSLVCFSWAASDLCYHDPGNPSKYWKYIAQSPSVASSRKVLIMGSASNRENDPCKGLASAFTMHLLVLSMPVNTRSTMCGMMNSRQKITITYSRQYDQPSKLIDSSANRGLVIVQIPPWWPRVITLLYVEVEGQDTSMTDTFDNLFVSILSKEKRDLILFVQPDRLLCQWWFPRYDHGWRRDPRQLFKLPGPIAPANTLGNIPTTLLASDYSATTKKPRWWSMPFTAD